MALYFIPNLPQLLPLTSRRRLPLPPLSILQIRHSLLVLRPKLLCERLISKIKFIAISLFIEFLEVELVALVAVGVPVVDVRDVLGAFVARVHYEWHAGDALPVEGAAVHGLAVEEAGYVALAPVLSLFLHSEVILTDQIHLELILLVEIIAAVCLGVVLGWAESGNRLNERVDLLLSLEKFILITL